MEHCYKTDLHVSHFSIARAIFDLSKENNVYEILESWKDRSTDVESCAGVHHRGLQ